VSCDVMLAAFGDVNKRAIGHRYRFCPWVGIHASYSTQFRETATPTPTAKEREQKRTIWIQLAQ